MFIKDLRIREMSPADWPQVKRIYSEGIATGQATFETNAPEWEEWNRSHLKHCRFIAETDNMVVGWAALSSISDRCAYQGVAEISIYVAGSARGGGVGKALMKHIVDQSEKNGIWTLQAGIFPENDASVKLHENYGFRIVGTRARLGKLNGQWRDVLFLERRSNKTGV